LKLLKFLLFFGDSGLSLEGGKIAYDLSTGDPVRIPYSNGRFRIYEVRLNSAA